MRDFYSQPIENWVKQSSTIYCAKALVEKDLRWFIRHFCFVLMTRNNIAETDKSLPSVLSELSNGAWAQKTIRSELAEMAKEGEFSRIGYKKLKWNPDIANKVVNFKNKMGYEGSDIELNEIQRTLIEKLNNMIRKKPYDPPYEDEMKAALKKIDKLEEKLEAMEKESKARHKELMDILRGDSRPEEIVEKVKRHLEIVR